MDFGLHPSERESSTGGDSSGINSPLVSTPDEPEGPPGGGGPWARLKRLIIHNILQLDGSPHSIALGVFIGFVIGMTPTIGIQMVSYFAIAAMTGANRVSGLLPVWVSNPITAVPLYYFNWRVGVFCMTGSLGGDARSHAELAALIENAPGQDMPLFERLTSAEFWDMALDLFIALGVELWVGCIVVGLVTGVVGYWATYRGVRAYRRRQQV